MKQKTLIDYGFMYGISKIDKGRQMTLTEFVK